MDELRRNNPVRLTLNSGEVIEGEVVDFSSDRVTVLIHPEYLTLAHKAKELDSVSVVVDTHLGLKQMYSDVIDEINSINCITLENSPTVPIVQKRAFVRVTSDLKFKISKNNMFYDCVCVNISAGGVAFRLHNSDLNIGDDVTIAFPKHDFEQDILTKAAIIKKDGDWHVAKYIDLTPRDEDRIVKYVFKKIVKY